MKTEAISAAELRRILVAVAEKMIASTDVLTEADQMGDADHGTGMKRGFTAVRAALDELDESATVEQLFSTIGMTLMSKVGGASGAIFGTFFRSFGKTLKGADALTADALASGLREGLNDVGKRGNARPGDKTMIDALDPAVAAAESCTNRDVGIVACLGEIADAAEAGMEKTKEMIATTGKAKTLGDRTIGHVDPGALSMSIILRTMADEAAKR
jgi:phosphoenolpyruvate---glycerone phosphotransferase subunit DhaL